MKLGNLFSVVIGVVFVSSMMFAGSSKMNFAKVYKQQCQGCHGAIHQGGVGSDLRPKVLLRTNAQMLAETILEGRVGTAMPAWKSSFSKDDAAGMVDWLTNWKNSITLKLSLADVKKTWKKLANRVELYKKYKTPYDVKSPKDIIFATERDASLVDFIDGTTGKVLSRHKAGYAVHVTVTNKRIPRYAYSISRSGRLTMFDLNAPGQPAIASVQVGQESRGLAVSPDGKYVMAGDYNPGGAVLCDALTLKPLKVYPTSSVIDTNGNVGPSRVAYIADTPYRPYFTFALKDGGHVYVVDYSKPDFPIVADISGIGRVLHDAFENEGTDEGRFIYVASQGSDLIGVIDLKTLKLAAKIYTGPGSKPHPGQGSSWYNERYGQLEATNSMNVGDVVIWNKDNEVVANVLTAGGGLFVGTSEETPYIWSDCVIGGPHNYNKMFLINKQTLKVDRIIEVNKKKGHLIDAHSGKVLQTWDATQYKTVKHKEVQSKISNELLVPYTAKHGAKVANPVQPRILHAEPANYDKWATISEWTTGRIGIYDSKTGKFIKYIYNLTTPTFTYSVSHREKIPGA